MLLVGLYDMVDQRAVLRQEDAGNLERFAVPHLRGPHFDVLLRALLLLHLRRLEADLSAHTEVGHHVENEFFEHRIFRELLEDV